MLVSWHSKRNIGPFQQSVTIATSDPHRPEITLTIKGEYVQHLYADPDELNYGQIAGNAPITREARIFCNLPSQQIKIQRHQLSDLSLEKFFQVDYLPLSADELRKEKGATSGSLVRVTVKPGLPLGRFQQRILLETNLPAAADKEIELTLFGKVGEVSLVGPGWSSETGVLDIGPVDGRSVTQRRLIILTRGPRAEETGVPRGECRSRSFDSETGQNNRLGQGRSLPRPNSCSKSPTARAWERKPPANYLGEEQGKLGEILLETTHPPVHSLRIRVRFAVPAANSH